MNLNVDLNEADFVDEVRAFLHEKLPPDRRFVSHELSHMKKQDTIWWQQILAQKGWLVPSWPMEDGGTGWSIPKQFIFRRECQNAGAPRVSPFGPVMVGPVISNFGTEEQKRRFLPGIREGTTLWCQGYSEPGSGSDLASLQTRARQDGDHYIVNGQKIWTTQAHWADWIFCLVRTATVAKPQAGISFLLIEMRSPGIEVKPIVSIDGMHHLNEVYFTDVRVPTENRIGEENRGWDYAKFLLGHERLSVADTAASKSKLEWFRSATDFFGGDYVYEPDTIRRLADLEIRLMALEMTEARALVAEDGSHEARRISLPLKLLGTHLQQHIAEFGLASAGQTSLAKRSAASELPATSFSGAGASLMESYLFGRSSTIYGGTSEIQKDIMAKMILGL